MAGESRNPMRRGATRTSGKASRPSRKKGTVTPAGTRTRAKWVYLLSEGDATMKALLGGKGANLAEMTRLGLPVPPGFVVTTAACNAYLARGAAPDGMWPQIRAALARLERATGKRFGDPANPLLVSCRSGARVLDAGHDGHGAEPRAERRRRRGPRAAHGRPALRVRCVPAARADVRHRGAGHARRAVRGGTREVPRAARRGQRRGPGRRRPCGDQPCVQGAGDRAHEAGRSRTSRGSSSRWPSRPCFARGTASAPSTTATRRASRTTSAPR